MGRWCVSQARRLADRRDVEVGVFRDRTLAEMVWPYVFLDDTYCKGPGQPPGGVLGGGDRDRGDRRWAPGGAGFEVGDSEDAALWTAFLGSLRPAGLGVQLVISTSPPG
jgi:putative transposase